MPKDKKKTGKLEAEELEKRVAPFGEIGFREDPAGGDTGGDTSGGGGSTGDTADSGSTEPTDTSKQPDIPGRTPNP